MSCLGCGATLTKRHQKVYCSNRCQRAMERRRNIERWLATGVAQTASNIGHDIRTYLLEDQRHTCAICGSPNDVERHRAAVRPRPRRRRREQQPT